jgi:hypothetical protein
MTCTHPSRPPSRDLAPPLPNAMYHEAPDQVRGGKATA